MHTYEQIISERLEAIDKAAAYKAIGLPWPAWFVLHYARLW
jgi:hypothetical protein